jgi:hypothetical protein
VSHDDKEREGEVRQEGDDYHKGAGEEAEEAERLRETHPEVGLPHGGISIGVVNSWNDPEDTSLLKPPTPPPAEEEGNPEADRTKEGEADR